MWVPEHPQINYYACTVIVPAAVPIEATAPLGCVGVPAVTNASDMQGVFTDAKEPEPQVMIVATGNLKPLVRILISSFPKPLTP